MVLRVTFFVACALLMSAGTQASAREIPVVESCRGDLSGDVADAAVDLRAHILAQPSLTKATVRLDDPLIHVPLARTNQRLKMMLPARADWPEALTSAHVLTASVDEILARPAATTLRFVTVVRLIYALAEHTAYFERGESSLAQARAARALLLQTPEEHADPLFASRAQLDGFLGGLFIGSHFGHGELGPLDILRVGLGRWLQLPTANEVGLEVRLRALSRGIMLISIEDHDAPTDFRREQRRNFAKFQKREYAPESAAFWDALSPGLDQTSLGQAFEFFHEHAHPLSCASLPEFRAAYGETGVRGQLGTALTKLCAPKSFLSRLLNRR